MIIFEGLLLIFLIVCAVAVALTRQLWQAIIIFMSYSLVMSVVWVFLQAPDLAVTEAAVGAGITSILFFLALKRINAMQTGKKGGKGK
ncbi:MAG: hydrogenase subunit MbhD domain-containing protein [Clostridiales bacterium]